MYFCAIFLLPIRFVHLIGGIIVCCIIAQVAMIGFNPKNGLTGLRRIFMRSVIQSLARSALFALGFYKIDYKKLNISDYDPTYPKTEVLKNESTHAPIVISNHVSWIDILIHMASDNSPSFLAKKAVGSMPLVGPIARGIQCIFVERESKDERGNVVAELKERVEKVAANPVNIPPVLIFPEGTTTNGEYLISFKKGAFINFSPVKIYGIQYTNKNFSPAFDTLGMGNGLLFTLLQLNNSVTFSDFGTFDPEYLNLKEEDDWKIYARKVKNVMLKALDLKNSEQGYTDNVVYSKAIGA